MKYWGLVILGNLAWVWTFGLITGYNMTNSWEWWAMLVSVGVYRECMYLADKNSPWN